MTPRRAPSSKPPSGPWYAGHARAFEAFDTAHVGRGNDQLGPGFYFTTREATARGYGPALFEVTIAWKRAAVPYTQIPAALLDNLLALPPGQWDIENDENWGERSGQAAREKVRALFARMWTIEVLQRIQETLQWYREEPARLVAALVRGGYTGLVVPAGSTAQGPNPDAQGELWAVVWDPKAITITSSPGVTKRQDNPVTTPCVPAATGKPLEGAILQKLLGERVRIHLNLHNGCYVISHQGKVVAYTRTFHLLEATPKVGMAGYLACHESQVRNVHAFLEGTLVGAEPPEGTRGWRRLSYNCKTHGPCFFYADDDVCWNGSAEVRAGCEPDGEGERCRIEVRGALSAPVARRRKNPDPSTEPHTRAALRKDGWRELTRSDFADRYGHVERFWDDLVKELDAGIDAATKNQRIDEIFDDFVDRDLDPPEGLDEASELLLRWNDDDAFGAHPTVWYR